MLAKLLMTVRERDRQTDRHRQTDRQRRGECEQIVDSAFSLGH